ncbi:hypothetical protein ACH41H_30030 [Streptomyces sp. NPDC020800]|uniref:hypothetical protein n=1 Tax=Streptomyces sp. NPDC020800 TaxID=3365092 RepID=UPI003796EF51
MTSSSEGGSGPDPGSHLRVVRSPQKILRTRASLALVVLTLVLTAAQAIWLGVFDFIGALTFTGRITGAVLILASFTTLLGAAATLDHWFRNCFAYSGLVALIGAVAALVTNGMLLAETWRDGDSVSYPVRWGLLTAGSLWAVFALWRRSVTIPAPKRVAAAVLVSSGLALANFGYQHLYQPFQRGARPLITIDVGKPMLSQDRKRFAFPVDIKLENHSDVGFYVFGAEFHAMGERVPPAQKDRLRTQWRTDVRQQREFRERSPLSRQEVHQPGQLVLAQPWMDPGDWIEANDSFVTRTVVQLPIGTPYDQLAFYATAEFGRKDRVGLEHFDKTTYSWSGGKAPKWAAKENVDCAIYHARVHESNAIDEHTRDPRYITIYWQFGMHGAGVIDTITRRDEADQVHSDAENRDARSRYGLVDAGAGPVEQTLWDIKSRR